MSDDALPARFARRLARLEAVEPGDRLLVALSGGLDSVVLTHLLRFAPGLPETDLVLAHLDHAMRPSSPGDAAWVRGLARAWELPLRSHRLDGAPASEAEARDARYGWLRTVRDEEGARWIVTAHHADDQAETVLFRAARGTGIRGLRGMPPVFREWRVLRPLLPFWREELEGYAGRVGLGWRTDPTNLAPGPARNALRHRVLPLLEREVAPGARRALVRLARRARRSEEGFRSLLEPALEGLIEEEDEGAISVARPAFLAYHPEVRARVLRELARRLGSRLSGAGTRAAVQFTKRGLSGRGVDVGDDLRLERSFDSLVLHRAGGGPDPRETLSVEVTREGAGELRLGRRSWRVRWSPGPDEGGPAEDPWSARLAAEAVRLPLRMRGWRPGDRIRLSYGSKKLKKLFGEARVPARERSDRPVLVDGEGRVLWVPGVPGARSVEARLDESAAAGDAPRAGVLSIEVGDAREH